MQVFVEYSKKHRYKYKQNCTVTKIVERFSKKGLSDPSCNRSVRNRRETVVQREIFTNFVPFFFFLSFFSVFLEQAPT